MAKVEIKKREDVSNSANKSDGLIFFDYQILVDGIEIDKMTGINLNMDASEINSCTLSFLVDDLQVDAEFVSALQAQLEERKA
ncbi:hypothetical protein [Planococcus faecalis]|uniref:Uncharacterized protein n=1 Tax=Planococcus faecalis TaxID=1598147 RepID=A0ABN4XRF8_9BACL|nr:hypothetical protein [Planococcus faecalis]AQU79729.1 hypothetical protein AJGP001_10840 [Planococcus faecalis]OHX52074.1 hypothetical protein BB777_14175 [Planococcus faecalis]